MTQRVYGNTVDGGNGIGDTTTHSDEKWTRYHVEYWGADPTGTYDSTEAVQRAIDVAWADGGGTVYFSAGTYIVGTLTMYGGITLKGTGWNTVLQLADGTDANLIETPTGQANYYGSVEDMTLDGNKANNSAGNCLYFFGADRFQVRRVRILNAADNGIFYEGNAFYYTIQPWVRESYIYGCDGHGVLLGDYATDGQIIGCDIGACDSGIRILSAGGQGVFNTYCWGCNNGLSTYWSSYIQIDSSRFDYNNYHGIWLYGVRQFNITSCNFYKNSQAASNTYHGIYLSGDSTYSTRDGSIVGCLLGDGTGTATQKYGIADDGSHANYITLAGNTYTGNVTGTKSLSGANNKDLDAHLTNTSNPHNVTLAQVGGTTDHGSLGGLSDYDHPQYQKRPVHYSYRPTSDVSLSAGWNFIQIASLGSLVANSEITAHCSVRTTLALNNLAIFFANGAVTSVTDGNILEGCHGYCVGGVSGHAVSASHKLASAGTTYVYIGIYVDSACTLDVQGGASPAEQYSWGSVTVLPA